MREIKFRIYNPREARMAESGSTPMMLHSFFKATAPFETRDEMEYQQYTGLKDKSGKEIYEGDIVTLADGIYEIIFEQGDFQTGFKKKSGNNLTDMGIEFADKLEIIGNIYENKDLLESNGT